MPRHDRAHGTVVEKRQSGGSSRRTRKRGKNTYAPKMGRNDGNTPKPNKPAPQKPKPKGGGK
jgi:hypothetical protein